jgi:radical SAM protein with 4Fe4S-binding SPASM domain
MSIHEFLRNEKHSNCVNGIEIHPADGFGYYSPICTRNPDWNGCPAGICSCGITSDGKIKGCLSMPDSMTEGDLRERDLWSIWFDPGSFSYNRSFTTADLGNFCQGCTHGEQCKGGCSIVSLSATGKLHNDPYCFCRMKKSNSVVA